jgi:hypothetical protein
MNLSAQDIIEKSGNTMKQYIFDILTNKSKITNRNSIAIVYDINYRRVSIFYEEQRIGFADIWIDENGELHIDYKNIILKR